MAMMNCEVDHKCTAAAVEKYTTLGRNVNIDAILALRLLLSDIHREFNRPLRVAHVDIKAAFYSVDRVVESIEG